MCIFAAITVAAICYYSSHKIVVVAESEQGQTINVTKSGSSSDDEGEKLLFDENQVNPHIYAYHWKILSKQET